VTVKNTTVINYYGNGNGIGIYLDSSSGNTVSGNNLANNWLGIYLGYSSDNTVSGNNFANNVYGICCYYSSDNNTFSGNTFTANQNGGIVIGASSNNNVVSGNNVANSIYAIEIHSSSSNNTVSGNNATNSVAGIYLDYSSNNNVLSGNNITNNYYGILLGTSSGNTFFHNRLVNNVQQVSSDGSLNAWDNGYPSGGNYWSNYAGTDVYSGPGQNVPRSDGIGDAPYVIGSNNVDHYPLYASTFTPQQLIVTVLPSNEGITDPLPGDYYAYANPVIVSATPNVGYQFDHWMLDGVGAGTSPSITVTMGGSHTLQAVFVPFAGDIYIRADGSVDPWNAPIATSDNITYVLTANVFGSLTIERDNIVFDGAGHTFTGSGAGHGITLSGRSNVTVKNTTVINYYGNGNGIGIYLDSSSGNTLSGNTVANNDHGIDLVSAYNNVLSDNTVTASNGWGIYLLSSSGNVLSGNNVTSNTDYGIWLSSSSGNVLSGNNVTSNTWYGIWISSSPYTALSGNNAANNFYGIWLSHSSNCILSGNNVTNNRYGICLYSYSSDNNTLSENSVTANNQDGIYIYGSSGNVLSGNNVSYNGYGIYLDSSFSNTIFHNRFVNNTNQVYSTGQANVWDNGYPSGGNYWSNYAGTDVYSGPGQNVPRSDGIGDTPYTINENNRDNYPWMAANYTAPYQITFDQTGVGDDFGSPVITVDGADYNRSGVSFWWIDGSSHTFAYASPLVATANVKQYVLTGVTASSPYTVSGSATITCSYKTQYNVTFAQSGLDSDASGTVVTIGGSAKVKADLPLTDWFDNETVYSYETIVSGGSGKQFAKTGITGPASPITASGTVNASYKTQYFLTMNTAFGTTNPVSGWFDARSKISISAAAPSAILGERYTSFRWTGIGAGSYTGSSNLATVTMKSPIWETAAWAHQYQLTIKTIGVPSHYSADVSLGGHDVGHASDASPFTMWITTGASTGTIGVDTSVSAGSNTRYVFTLWSDGPTSNPRSSITMSAPQTLTANYKTVYKTTFSLSGVGRDFSGTVAIIDGVSYARSSLPVSFWWDKDSTHSFEYKSPLTVKTGSYVWKSTKGLSSKQSDTTFTVSSAGTITGNYVK
jgi:parallel beta-helix repeat protein